MLHIGHTETVADSADRTYNNRPRWLAVVTGLNLAIAVSYLLCKPPQTHTLSLNARLLSSAAYILIACAAGSFGTWIALSRDSRHQFPSLALWSIRCWVFLPSIMMFLREKAVWAPLIAFLSAILMAVYLSRMPGVTAYRPSQQAETHQDIEKYIFITQLHFEPVSWATFTASLCLYGAVTSAIAGKTALLTLLLAIGTFLLVSQIIATQSKARDQASPRSRPYSLLTSAFLCVFVALSVPGQMRSVHMQDPAASALRSARQASQGNSSAGYRTIVLWPVPKKEKMIISPSLAIDTTAGHKAKPWVIPFDGPYWYFKIPGESPGSMARTAHGDPLKVNVRSTDSSPLLMEAHQYLPDPVDLSCCREIQVVFSNDVSLGASQVGISLTDSHAKSKPTQSLGIKSIPISDLDPMQAGTLPVEQTVSFPLPKPGTIRQFDQITVVLLPHHQFSTAGRKVAIERFIMIPR
jgi:hypothetical protein